MPLPRSFRLLPVLLLGACTWFSNRGQVLVTSDPLGAHIFVDGEDTGLTTPAPLEIGGILGTDHVIELQLKGHRSATRRVYQYTEGYTSKWIDGAYDLVMPPLPLFWTTGDMLTPFAVRGGIVPAEVYVKLYREDEPKLGFELLAEREGAATGGAQ